jgi:hypothetical protein
LRPFVLLPPVFLPYFILFAFLLSYILFSFIFYPYLSRLGGVVFSVLATGPKGRGFEAGQGDGFLRTIKIRSTSSFGWEVKPEVPCDKILRQVKDLLKSHGDE